MSGNECSCGNWKNKNAERCWSCGNEARRRTLTGVPHTEERRRKNSEAGKRQANRFDLAALMRGQPSPRAKPIGSTRIDNGHIKIKCSDGKWRYRARVMWTEAHGPINKAQLVHHINEDPFDDRLENFQLVTRSQHMRIHSTPEKMREKQVKAVAARKRNSTA